MKALPPGLVSTPSLDRWIGLSENRKIVAYTGKVEIGQGLLTALRTIVAEELDVAPESILVVSAHTGHTPEEGVTAGSMSIETSGAALRQASAWARRLLIDDAAARLGIAADQLAINNGEITAPGINESLDYWQLYTGSFNFEIRALTPEKSPDRYRLVGHTGQSRIDVPAKATGAAFVHDASAELHARVIRPPSLNHRLTGINAEVTSPGELIVDGSFVAVAHPHEFKAEQLAMTVSANATWHRLDAPEANFDIDETRRVRAAAFPILNGTPTLTPPTPINTAHRASYSRPFLMHASLGPSAATAVWRDGTLTIESASQGIEPLRLVIARALRMEDANIEIRHIAGAGCYGHNGADDAAFDAALIALALPGRKVLLKWSRADEHGFEPFGPAMRMELGADLDDDGHVLTWTHDVYGFTHVSRPSPHAPGVDLLAARLLQQPLSHSPPVPRLTPEVGIHRNALPIYAFDTQHVTKHFIADSPVRTSALRGLGAQGNVFAIESFMDELAHFSGTGPDVFRRRHLGHDTRALAVLDAVLESCGGLTGNRGLGLARYKNRQCCAAVVVEVSVDENTAEIQVPRLWIAADAGRVIDPDGLRNQLEGGAVQALSWCLKEAVTFDTEGVVTSRDWESYPILRFSEIPEVETVLLDHPEMDPVGAGEATVGPTSAALANAVFAATGLRVRDLPMTPQCLRGVAAQ
ncbi:MAG: molybdopterin-dependent oxidoreductase [Gammaproteobacteria bacterium]|nr:molybdopterin-dependent oxidoreductase [Gammaproteobacteria bacterium]